VTDQPDDISIHQLPPQLKMLIQRIGYPATIALIRARGGQQVWIPKTATADRVLAQVIGKEALGELVKHHGGERLELPKVDKILIQRRDEALWRKRQAGATESELAREFKITRRWVLEICARRRREQAEGQRQGRLFDACANGDSGAH
jgi:hypothetical protein